MLEGVRGNLPEPSRDALDTFYREADRPAAFLAELRALVQGLRGKAYPWATVGRALEEMAAAGGSWSPRRMQVFCRKLAERAPEEIVLETDDCGVMCRWRVEPDGTKTKIGVAA